MKSVACFKPDSSAMSPSIRREWIEMLGREPAPERDESPSIRREWIEMKMVDDTIRKYWVSLHTEGVD